MEIESFSTEVQKSGGPAEAQSSSRCQFCTGTVTIKKAYIYACASFQLFLVLLVILLCFLYLGPYKLVTGNYGYSWPENYGKVKEKTIWVYWDTLPVPEHLQLMMDTMQHNKGSFDVRIVSKHDFEKYVSRSELPFQWNYLGLAQQKDALMNALLARYGGVAFDASIFLFEPLDKWWDEMVAEKAIFRGYMYDHTETVVWFMMSRAGGIFGHAVANQIIGMGAHFTTTHYDANNQGRYFAMGDGTITPVIGRYDYSRRKCFGPKKDENVCSPQLPDENVPELGRELLMIASPLDGPQLPFATDHNFLLWKISEHKDQWDDFIRRRNVTDLLLFVKAFNCGGNELKKMKKTEILELKDSFMCYFLCLAGPNQCGIDCSAESARVVV
jgi:hypothetical protein